jgi:O-antigen/teichoic acid export membrane protein
MTADATTVEGAGPTAARTLLRRIVAYAPSSVLPAALTLATSMVFTRIFSAAAFGTYSLFLVIANPAKLLLTTWVSQALGKYVPAEQTVEGRQRAKDAVFVSVGIVVCVESVLGLAALAIAGPRLGEEQAAFLVPMIAFVVVTSVFELFSNVLAAEHRAREYTGFKVTDSVLTFGLRLLLVSALIRMDLTLMFWSVVLSNGVLLPLLWRRVGFPRPARLIALARSERTRRTVRAFGVFGLPMTVWFFSSVLLDVGDRFVINHFMGPAPVGIYDANYRLISGTAVLMVVPVTITLHPYLMSVSGSGDARRIAAVIGTIVENIALVGLLAVGLTFLFSKDIATLLLGPEFRAGHVIMPIVLAGVIFANIGTFTHKPFEIIGRTRPMVVFGLLAAAVNVGLNLVLVPWAGYVGSAWATFFSYVLYAVAVGVGGRRIFPWTLDLRRGAAYASVIVVGIGGIALLRAALAGLPYWRGLVAAIVASGALATWCVVGLLRNRPVHHALRR